MKTLLIIGHPKYNNSIANKTIAENIIKETKITYRNLSKLYPNYKINVKKEQSFLLKSDLLIFQFPIYWASMPAILKLWFDEVFTNGFAYGSSYQLKNKRVLVSVTLSGKNNTKSRLNVHEKILFPFKGISEFCKMKYLIPQILYEIDYSQNKPIEFFIEKSLNHSKKIIKIIKNEE
jgi:glutathione-regulated potassium-efflux system ancillary protein KefF